MQPLTDGDYKKLLTELIKKQIIVLGPDITLAKVKNVPNMVVEQDGTVTQITGNPQEVVQGLIAQFVELSGMIVKKTMEPLLASFPGAVANIPQQQAPIPTVNQTPVQPAATPTPPPAQPADKTGEPIPSTNATEPKAQEPNSG